MNKIKLSGFLTFVLIFLVSSPALAATYTVTSTNDLGAGTLRQAILDANTNPGTDLISFNIPTSEATSEASVYWWRIQPVTDLPTITETLTIDGTTQPTTETYSNPYGPVVEINGKLNTSSSSIGLNISASYCVITGLVLNDDYYTAIRLGSSANYNALIGNYIGTNVTGTTFEGTQIARGVDVNGIYNRIGDSTPSGRNLISGTTDFGIQLYGPACQYNEILGNYIGTDRTGTVMIVTGTSSILVSQGPKYNKIGNGTVGGRNVICSKIATPPPICSSIRFTGSISNIPTSNEVLGNYIGVDVTGEAQLGGSYGIYMDYGRYNRIGGSFEGERNVISGNNYIGIILTSANSDNNIIIGNYIGTDKDGMASIKNNSGVEIRDNSNNNIVRNNVISGNQVNGIGIWGSAAVFDPNNNYVLGNYIGVASDGVTYRGNGDAGIFLSRASRNHIGDGTAQGRNIISNHIGTNSTGILMDNSTSNEVLGNYIGLDVSGTLSKGNRRNVRILNGSRNNMIGDGTLGGSNKIAYSVYDGITIEGSTTWYNSIRRNSIFNNSKKGIGLTPGANENIPYPLIRFCSYNGVGSTLVSGESVPNAIVDIYLPDNDASGYGEGLTFEVSTTANSSGLWSANLTGLLPGNKVTATSTDPNGNTSEFAKNVIVRLLDHFVVRLPETVVMSTAATATFVATIEARDSDGNLTYPILGTTSIFVDYGVVSPESLPSSVFDGDGTWTGLMTLDAVGLRTVIASNEIRVGFDTIDVYGLPTLNSFTVITPSRAVVGRGMLLTIEARDASNNITTEVVTPTGILIDSGTILPVSIHESGFRDDGVWTGIVTLSASGIRTITASSDGSTGDNTVEVYPAPTLNYFTVIAPPISIIDQGFLVTVEARDSLNNITTEVVGTTSLLVDAGTILPISISEADLRDDGIWTGIVTLDASGMVTITASNEGKTGSDTIQMNAPSSPRIYNIKFDGILYNSLPGVVNIINPRPLLTADITIEIAGSHISSVEVGVDNSGRFAGSDESWATTNPITFNYQFTQDIPVGARTVSIKAISSLGTSTESELPVLVGARGAPQVIGALAVYPAPFRPNSGETAIIAYNLTMDTNAKIFIYDVSGRIIWTHMFPAGTNGGRTGYNGVTWNGRTDFGSIAPNGIHIIKVIANGKQLTKGKVVVYD